MWKLFRARVAIHWFLPCRGGFRGEQGDARNHLFFFFFKELQTVFIEVKVIINNVPLTCIYPNTIKTYLTSNHLLFDRQLLCYSKTASALIKNITVLSRPTHTMSRISNNFWHRLGHEYAINVRETQ